MKGEHEPMDYLEMLRHPDSIIFLVIQGAVVVVTIYTAIRQFVNRLRPRGVIAEVIRGDRSWNRFFGIHGLLLVLMFQFIAVAEITTGYRVIFCLFNFLLVTYLTLGNGWFRNWSVGWLSRMQKRPER